MGKPSRTLDNVFERFPVPEGIFARVTNFTFQFDGAGFGEIRDRFDQNGVSALQFHFAAASHRFGQIYTQKRGFAHTFSTDGMAGDFGLIERGRVLQAASHEDGIRQVTGGGHRVFARVAHRAADTNGLLWVCWRGLGFQALHDWRKKYVSREGFRIIVFAVRAYSAWRLGP